MRKLLLLLMLLIPGAALAGNITLYWSNPTNEAWDFVQIWRVTGPDSYIKLTEVQGSLRQATIENLTPGQYVFAATATMAGVSSDYSKTLTVDIKPAAPENLRLIAVSVNPDGTISTRLITIAELKEFFRA